MYSITRPCCTNIALFHTVLGYVCVLVYALHSKKNTHTIISLCQTVFKIGRFLRLEEYDINTINYCPYNLYSLGQESCENVIHRNGSFGTSVFFVAPEVIPCSLLQDCPQMVATCHWIKLMDFFVLWLLHPGTDLLTLLFRRLQLFQLDFNFVRLLFQMC